MGAESDDELSELQTEFNKKLDDIKDRLSKVENLTANVSSQALESRLADLSAEKADKGEHSTVMDRLSLIENRSRMWDAMEDNYKKVRGNLDDIQTQVKREAEARDKHQRTLMERIDTLEKFLGETVEQHSKSLKEVQRALETSKNAHKEHRSTIEARFEKLEKKFEEMDGHLETDLEDLKSKLEVVDGVLQKEVQQLYAKHSDIEAGLEKRSKDLNARLQVLEASADDHSGKHNTHLKEIETAQSKLKELQTRLSGEKMDREKFITSLEERLRTLEKQLADTAKKQSQQLDNMESTQKNLSRNINELSGSVKDAKDARSILDRRINSLEGAIGDSHGKHDKHLKEMEAAQNKIQELNKLIANEKNTRDGHHATVAERLDYLEQIMGDSADSHSKALDTLESNHQKVKKLVDDLHGKVKSDKFERDDHHANISERLDFLEQRIGESTDKQNQHKKDVETAQNRIKDLNGQMDIEKSKNDKHKANMEERLEFF